MNKQRKSVLLAGITALLSLMFLTACPVKPAKPADEKKSEVTPESILNSVFEVKWSGDQEYPKTDSKHHYIYIGPDGIVYEAEKDNGAELKKPDISLFAGVKVENNQFVQGERKYPYTLKNGTLTVGKPREPGQFGLEAIRVTSPTGEEIMAVQKNKAEAEQLQ
ncbi:hypothetical protein [Treponema pedis]|uniref:hypothetical protein n=1 Tax=Treponema pedis TaxID=409322 RepID=UPI0004669CCA|nr:hypothetical protein [Treponema pedis]